MTFKLYTYTVNTDNFRAVKILVAAEYSGIKIDLPKFEFGVSNKTDEFLKLNPNGKVPLLETPNGPLYESNAIAKYVARLRADNSLYGSNFFESGLVDQWLDWGTHELEPGRAVWLFPILGYFGFNPKAYTEAKKEVAVSLKVLDNHLLHKTFLVGNRITLADISIASTLLALYARVFTPEFVAPFPNVTRWFTTLINQPEFAKIIGKFKFATTEEQAASGKKEEKKKEEKPAKQAAEPKPKKEKEPAPAEEKTLEDIADEEQAAAKKKKNPLDDLPPTKLVLDDTKRLAFSERPIKKDFFELLWPQFDAEGWSWWTCFYKYNEENKVLYMTANLVGGFLQRSDSCRKYALSVMNLYGNEDEETPPFKVAGCWMFRGPAIIQEMLENPDSEYYEWKKLDVSSEADRATIKSFFTADTLEGQKVLERRYFK